jgi:cytochrome c2
MTIRSAILLAFGLASLHGAGAAPPFVGGLARHEKASPKISGAVLINELSCVACHASSRAEFAAKSGPDLSTVGSRVMGEHLRRFIEAPSTTKSGTTMPDVLGHLPAAERASRAEALAHYLASLGGQSALWFHRPQKRTDQIFEEGEECIGGLCQ